MSEVGRKGVRERKAYLGVFLFHEDAQLIEPHHPIVCRSLDWHCFGFDLGLALAFGL